MNAPKYLEKYAFQAPVIQEKPSLELNQIVVIPCFDEPDLWSSLKSLYNCDATKGAVEVIVVLNQSENAGELDNNQKVLAQFPQWKAEHDSDLKKFHLISALNLPKKHAGVGLARKIGMDEAVYRFHLSGKEDGIITCFDADSGCLSNRPCYRLFCKIVCIRFAFDNAFCNTFSLARHRFGRLPISCG